MRQVAEQVERTARRSLTAVLRVAVDLTSLLTPPDRRGRLGPRARRAPGPPRRPGAHRLRRDLAGPRPPARRRAPRGGHRRPADGRPAAARGVAARRPPAHRAGSAATTSSGARTSCVPPTAARRPGRTVHDLTPLRFPELANVDTLPYPALHPAGAAAGAPGSTPPSAFVRDEVIDHLRRRPRAGGRHPPRRRGRTPRATRRPGRALAGGDRYVLAARHGRAPQGPAHAGPAFDALAAGRPRPAAGDRRGRRLGRRGADRGRGRRRPPRPHRAARLGRRRPPGRPAAGGGGLRLPLGVRGLRPAAARGHERRASRWWRPGPARCPRCAATAPTSCRWATPTRWRPRSAGSSTRRRAPRRAGRPGPCDVARRLRLGAVPPATECRVSGPCFDGDDVRYRVAPYVTGSQARPRPPTMTARESAGHRSWGLRRWPPGPSPRGQGDDVVELERNVDGIDIADADALTEAVVAAKPEAVYHLAGAADVGGSWAAPRETFLANAAGHAQRARGQPRRPAPSGCSPSPAPTSTAGSPRTSCRSTRTSRCARFARTPRPRWRPTPLAQQAWLGPPAARHPGAGLQPPRPGAERPVRGPVARRPHRPQRARRRRRGADRQPDAPARRHRRARRGAGLPAAHDRTASRARSTTCAAARRRRSQELAEALLGMARRPMRLVSDPALQRPVDIPVLVGDNGALRRGHRAGSPRSRSNRPWPTSWQTGGPALAADNLAALCTEETAT